MVPNKLVHSAELPLEHERAYARLFGKLEYLRLCPSDSTQAFRKPSKMSTVLKKRCLL